MSGKEQPGLLSPRRGHGILGGKWSHAQVLCHSLEQGVMKVEPITDTLEFLENHAV